MQLHLLNGLSCFSSLWGLSCGNEVCTLGFWAGATVRSFSIYASDGMFCVLTCLSGLRCTRFLLKHLCAFAPFFLAPWRLQRIKRNPWFIRKMDDSSGFFLVCCLEKCCRLQMHILQEVMIQQKEDKAEKCNHCKTRRSDELFQLGGHPRPPKGCSSLF